MAINAKDLIHLVVDQLQDVTSIRWPIPELVRYLNAGQREIIVHRPDALRKIVSAQVCSAGTRQTLPADAAELIEVLRNNSAASVRAVSLCQRSDLDAQIPNWHAIPEKDEILHYMYDPRDPMAFYNYPPASVNAKLDYIYAAYPTDVAEPVMGSVWSDVMGTIGVADKYANALVDYCKYRAYSKEGETQDLNKAAGAATMFATSLGIDLKALVAVAPKLGAGGGAG